MGLIGQPFPYMMESSMSVHSFWRCAGSAGVRPPAKAERTLHGRHSRLLSGQASISAKGGRGLLGAGSEACPGTVPAGRVTEDHALKSLQLENLRNAVTALDDQERKLVYLRYNDELSMEEIGRALGVSKMAVSKRLKKLHQKLRVSVS